MAWSGRVHQQGPEWLQKGSPDGAIPATPGYLLAKLIRSELKLVKSLQTAQIRISARIPDPGYPQNGPIWGPS